MNKVSDIDTDKAQKVDQPDILLGADWEDRARGEQDDDALDEIVPDKSRRGGFISLNRSPLARKIITFNLLALVVLVGGVLYLNQFRDGLVEQRETGMIAEAQLIARVIEADLASGATVTMAGRDFSGVLRGVDLAGRSEVLLFDRSEQVVATDLGQKQSNAADKIDTPHGTFMTDLLNVIWEKVSSILGDAAEVEVVSAQILARQSVPYALAGQTYSRVVSDEQGLLRFTVATPVLSQSRVIGAVVLTSLAGEIDEIARNEREQVLQMFVIAILVSIGLSLVLAGTIANPLRDLAEAAEAGRRRNSGAVSSDRIRIPDMTGRPDEIGRLSGAFRDMIAALYERIETNEQFAADVAHEIKNPLASLRSATDTLRVARTDDQRDRLLDVIEHDVRRLDRLVSDISNASRLDSELVKEGMEAFDLISMLNNLVEFHRQEAAERGSEFISDLPDEPIIIHGLEARLAQVVVNLLSNAISFCHDGDAVRIWARQRENRVLVVVEDTGPGIPDSAITKIFSRFYSERPDDFGNHSGLGLSISRQIVEAHGGVIWAENIRPTDADPNSEPLGARFVVGLPV